MENREHQALPVLSQEQQELSQDLIDLILDDETIELPADFADRVIRLGDRPPASIAWALGWCGEEMLEHYGDSIPNLKAALKVGIEQAEA